MYSYTCIATVAAEFKPCSWSISPSNWDTLSLPMTAERVAIPRENIYLQAGYHQSEDLEALISHIHQKFIDNPQIVLWGRSMGAVTAMNYLIKRMKLVDNVRVAVLDSPFINLKQVICQIVNKKLGAPKMLIDFLVSYLQPTVYEKAGFRISQVDLRNQIIKIKCPLILMASKSDGLVPFQHLQEIYQTHKGRKSIFYLQQSHIDQRLVQTINKIFKAINRYFLAQKKSLEQVPHATIKIKKLCGEVQLQSFRSSQYPCQSAIKSDKKSKKKKKITVTYPQSMGKLYTNRDSDFQYDYGKNLFNINKNKTELKKKKLSLNHLKNADKSPRKYRPTLYFDENKQKNFYGIHKTYDKYTEKNEQAHDATSKRILSEIFQRSNRQDNSERKKISHFYEQKNIRILNIRSKN